MAEAFLAGKPLDVMTQPFAPNSEGEAYSVQRRYIRMVCEARGSRVGGRKVAYTSAVMRERAGIGAPCGGLIIADGIRESPASVSASDYRALGIECEVGVRLRADLPASGAPYTRESVADAIEWLAAAFELIDARPNALGDGRRPDLRAIATNISNAGAVTGEPTRDWRALDLSAARGRMTVNGETVGKGVGADVMGHPLEPLAWLANSLARRGEGMRAGETILTGSFAPPYMLSAGDSAVVSIDGLGEARLTAAR